MLGRLLNTAAATLNPASYTTRNSNQLESVTEEEHTSGLLFPDASFLQRSRIHAYPLQTSVVSPSASTAGSFDDRGGLELDPLKDLRVIIAQNAIGDRDHPCILFDTQTPPKPERPNRRSLDPDTAERSRGKHSRTSTTSSRNPRLPPSHGHHSSITGITPLSPLSDQDAKVGAFFRARNRRSTFSSTPGDDTHSQARASGDSSELGLLNCIFGSSAFSYRGPSTKMHVVPTEGETTPEGPGNGNHGSQRRVPLRRADTYNDQSRTTSLSQERLNNTTASRSSPAKITVLVTRMFSVNLPEPRGVSTENSEQSTSADFVSFNDGRPAFPVGGKGKKIKEKKTPMYAVAITVRLPLSAKGGGRPYSQRNPYPQEGSKAPGCMSTSLDSYQRWNAIFDERNQSSANSSLDDRIDLLVDYWDVIARTLSRLEKLASREIFKLLKEVDQSSTQLRKPAKGPNMQRTNQTIVQLPPNSLSDNLLLREEGIHATRRVSLALRIPPVVTGQNRWGVWREEARWIARSLSEKEHNFFFLVLITAFLGNHTEWLSLLGPDWYRRRHYLQQKAQCDNGLNILNRTVIISPDKMAARRLIFVLSAFLPPQQRTDFLASPLRPSTSTSLRQTSQSPPNAHLFRQESLRRTINRRARNRQFNDEHNVPKRSASVSSNETPNAMAGELDFAKTPIPSSRRDSDARSIRTASLSVPANNATAMKSNTASTATAVSGTTTPVPHFASHQSKPYAGEDMNRGSRNNASAASTNLLQNLQRNENSNVSTVNNQYQPTKKWGNILSGFWASHEGQFSADGHTPDARHSVPQSERPELCTSEQSKIPGEPTDNAQSEIPSSGIISIPTSTTSHTDPLVAGNSHDAPYNQVTQPSSSPVKLCVEANEGIVDVEVPLPGFLSLSSSNDSTLTSPKKPRTSITSIDGDASFHSSSPWSHSSHKEYDGPNFNVAGCLKHYHDDFVLQAVRPYSTLETEIKKSMSAEPTPILPNLGSTSYFDKPSSEKWVDVCSTLIADVRTFTVKRIRLRRKISPKDLRPAFSSQSNSQSTSPQVPAYQSSNIAFDDSKMSTPIATSRRAEPSAVEEEFIEEPVMDLDGTLVDAVERVLSHSGQSSAIHSRAPSPTRARKSKSPMDDGKRRVDFAHRGETPPAEVPRNECRRMVLGALEEVVRSVTSEHRQEESAISTDANSRTFVDRGRKNTNLVTDNTLREGIRKWLQDIDESC